MLSEDKYQEQAETRRRNEQDLGQEIATDGIALPLQRRCLSHFQCIARDVDSSDGRVPDSPTILVLCHCIDQSAYGFT